jgi:hypothetical protein
MSDFLPTSSSIKFASDLTFASARLFRRSIELSHKLAIISPKLILLGRSTYFLSLLKLPISVYELKNVNSVTTLFKRVSIVGVDVFNVLKGMRAFNLLDERHLWIYKGSPIFCALTAISLTSLLNSQYSEFSQAKANYERNIGKGKCSEGTVDKRRQTLQNKFVICSLKLSSTTLNISGIALLFISPIILTPLIIPAYSLIAGSSILSLSHVVFAKIHEE